MACLQLDTALHLSFTVHTHPGRAGRLAASAPAPLIPPPHPELVQDRAPSRARLSSVLGPLCAGNGVSDALYDPKARAFPRPGLFPLPRPPLPTLLSHCLPHTQLVGGLEEQPGARAEPGRSRCKDSQWVFLSCRGWGCTGYQACWDLKPLDQTLLSSALKYTLYFNFLKILMFRATKNLNNHLVTLSKAQRG